MTLDEAIEHTEERACGNDQYANDHAQLADWLRELRRARMEIDLLKTLRDGFKADAQKYKAENVNLRELLLEAYETATELDCGGCYHVETCNEMPYCIKWVELEHRMRDELGIEVSK